MRKLMIALLIFLAALITVAGLYQFNMFDQFSNTNKTYSAEGISFNYPGQWKTYKPIEKGEITSIGDDGGKIMLAVYKFNATQNSTGSIKNNTKSNLKLDPFAANKTEINRTVDGINATEITYLSKDEESAFKESVLIFEKNGDSYVIQYRALPPELYDQNKGRFEMVIRSFSLDKS